MIDSNNPDAQTAAADQASLATIDQPGPASVGAETVAARPTDPVPSRVPWKAVVAFVVTALGLAWIVCIPLWRGGGLGNTQLLMLSAQIIMFVPAVATIVAMIIQRRRSPERLAGKARYLGIWPLTPVLRVVGITIAAIFGTYLLVAATYLLASAFGWVDLDVLGLSGFAANKGELGFGSMSMPVAVAMLLVVMLFNSLVTALFAFGEEVGWRGWLLTSLRPLGTWPALLITGVIWGIWHAPLILLGYNFNRPHLGGLALMVGGCVFMGILFGWTRIRTGSVWPAVFGHGALNGSTGLLLGLLMADGAEMPDMAFAALLGFPGWMTAAVIIIVLVVTGQFRKSPALGERS